MVLVLIQPLSGTQLRVALQYLNVVHVPVTMFAKAKLIVTRNKYYKLKISLSCLFIRHE